MPYSSVMHANVVCWFIRRKVLRVCTTRSLSSNCAGKYQFNEESIVFVTRLHVRYDREHFPEDLVFQETGDRQNYQGRYIIRHPWTSEMQCDASAYIAATRERQEREAQMLANLTGWNINEIRAKIPYLDGVTPKPAPSPWWKRIWQ